MNITSVPFLPLRSASQRVLPSMPSRANASACQPNGRVIVAVSAMAVLHLARRKAMARAAPRPGACGRIARGINRGHSRLRGKREAVLGRVAAVSFLLLLGLAGCSTARESEPARTATEELLISTAVDRALDGLQLKIPEGTKLWVDAANFDGYDQKYAV